MKQLGQRMAIFVDKYPLLGPLVWIFSVQYLIVQPLVAAAWPRTYSWSHNLISDLGNTACGQYGDRFVCSPDHLQMNLSFILLGITMAIGASLIYHEFRESRGSLVGFSLMAAGGFGTILVGLFPENTVSAMHFIGAVLGLLVGNISLIVLAVSLTNLPRSLRIYTAATGIFTIVCFVLFSLQINLGLGQGGIERLVGYPQTVWLIFFGLYMTRTRLNR